ncbi:hypothetical protein PYCCODRAFT_1054878 [Trametes coccinea BRFM310]|uniref:Uncharacterized protein n=1 Tax=Trametes coccinea (strain BRFM310) TaxID=1353009 RepID=A0A1Y2IXJ6_TRAC3|nr:hypothetical protein PYCCODRAFT_1054878 [Trametes coccinea BRFM310]
MVLPLLDNYGVHVPRDAAWLALERGRLVRRPSVQFVTGHQVIREGRSALHCICTLGGRQGDRARASASKYEEASPRRRVGPDARTSDAGLPRGRDAQVFRMLSVLRGTQ